MKSWLHVNITHLIILWIFCLSVGLVAFTTSFKCNCSFCVILYSYGCTQWTKLKMNLYDHYNHKYYFHFSKCLYIIARAVHLYWSHDLIRLSCQRFDLISQRITMCCIPSLYLYILQHMATFSWMNKHSHINMNPFWLFKKVH